MTQHGGGAPGLFNPRSTPLQLSGLAPLLAVSDTVLSGLATGLVFLTVLTAAGVTASLLRRLIPPSQMHVYLLLIAATWVTLVDLSLQAWCYPLREHLGVYLYVLAVNAALFHHLERSFLTAPPGRGARAGLRAGVTATALLTLAGAARELAGRGSLLTNPELLPGIGALAPSLQIVDGGLHVVNGAAGALLMAGLLLGAHGCFRLYCRRAPATPGT